ncbi:heme peroxidase [Trichoderma barbatum]
MSTDGKFQDGEASQAAKQEAPAGLLTKSLNHVINYTNMRSQVSLSDIVNLVMEVIHRGAPLDDRKGTTEILIGILTTLPATSEIRTQLTNKLITALWNNLQHPPLSYVGGDVQYEIVNSKKPTLQGFRKPDDSIEFKAPDYGFILRQSTPRESDGLQYRMPDGSFNSIIQPNLGKAGTAYARTVRPEKLLHGVKPDPGLLFDLLMARDDDTFKENPAGISSMLFYHAAIIVHDIFRTNRTDMNKSDVSSYLDLSPLYGSSLKDQLEIRTTKEGKLKPDTFHEKRLLGQPAGVNVMLVLYNRFHNYVADILLKINENGRFTLACTADASPEDKARAVAKQDHDLFNTARLIVGGLYINISLHDYLRAITNTHHSASDWTLDPRVDIANVPCGVGNQVSVEFNLLYRFHSCISKKDERWINNFFLKLFPGRNASDLKNVSWADLGQALVTFEQSVPKDPSLRTFDGLERQADGSFKDEDLVRILKEAMDDPAGVFGARMVPKALKIVEVLGINQARKWGVSSLNEFREFFGLKRHEQFTDINSNPDIASILEKLYTSPDMVELYPGLMVEDIKPVRNPGCGICPTYTVGRAVLSDAITLVRSDRFNTIDFTPANLTNWGYNEVRQDYKTLGGSMLYKLIQRGVPGWFPYNSVAVMQPMYTKKANAQIAKELGTLDQFTLDDPKPPAKPVVLFSGASIKQVLGNPEKFVVPWLTPLNALFPGKKDVSWFMLAGDGAHNFEHRANWVKIMGELPELHKAVADLIAHVGKTLIQKESFTLDKGLDQIDLIRDVAIPLNARLLADLFFFDLKSDDNPTGTLTTAELYRHLLNIRLWGVNNNDPGQAWNRRRRAQESAKVIIETTRKLVDEVKSRHCAGYFSYRKAGSWTAPKPGTLRSCGLKIVEKLLDQGISSEQVVDNIFLTAFGGVGVPVTAFYEVMEFFLRPENAIIWAEVQTLSQEGDSKLIQSYVVEAQRLTSSQRNVRIATQPIDLEGKSIQPGNVVVMMLGEAGRNPAEVSNAGKFDATRNAAAVSAFSYGQHECLAKHIGRAYMTGLVKLAADLKQLRPAPGQMGQVKTIHVGTEKAYLNETWSYLGFDASTWKVHFSGHGKGNFEGERMPTKLMDMQQYYYLLRRRKEELLKHKKPTVVTSVDEKTTTFIPLHKSEEDFVKRLADCDVNLNTKIEVGKFPVTDGEDYDKLLVDILAKMENPNSSTHERTVLRWVSGNGQENVIKDIFTNGAETDAQSDTHQTPLGMARAEAIHQLLKRYEAQ